MSAVRVDAPKLMPPLTRSLTSAATPRRQEQYVAVGAPLAAKPKAPALDSSGHWQPVSEELLRLKALESTDAARELQAVAEAERHWLAHLPAAEAHKRELAGLAVYEALTPLQGLVAAARILALVNLLEAVRRDACWHRLSAQVRRPLFGARVCRVGARPAASGTLLA